MRSAHVGIWDATVKGTGLIFPYTRGSAGAWRFLYQLYKHSNAPVAIITQVKGRTAWVVQGVLGLTACLVLTLAVHFAEAGRLDIADLALVSSYLLMLHYPTMRLGRQITRLGPQLTSAERLARLAEPSRPDEAT